MYTKLNKGITLLEIIIVIAITIIIASIVFLNFSDFKNERTLQNTVGEVVSLINKARINTISSLNSNNYSIHFENDKIVLFSGSNYDPNALDNEKILFEYSVEISLLDGVNLNGGGNDIIFEKITGETDNYGTIIIRLKSDNDIYRIININKLGVISEN